MASIDPGYPPDTRAAFASQDADFFRQDVASQRGFDRRVLYQIDLIPKRLLHLPADPAYINETQAVGQFDENVDVAFPVHVAAGG